MIDTTNAVPEPPQSDEPVIRVEMFEDVAEAAAWVDRELEALAKMEGECETYRDIAKKRKADVDMWAKQQTDRVEREMMYRRTQLEAAAKSFPYLGGKKSIDLINGSIGTRVQALSVEIRDEGKALRFSTKHDLSVSASLSTTVPELIDAMQELADKYNMESVEVEPRKEALLAFAREKRKTDPKWLPHALDDGWTINGGSDEPFVKVNKAQP